MVHQGDLGPRQVDRVAFLVVNGFARGSIWGLLLALHNAPHALLILLALQVLARDHRILRANRGSVQLFGAGVCLVLIKTLQARLLFFNISKNIYKFLFVSVVVFTRQVSQPRGFARGN